MVPVASFVFMAVTVVIAFGVPLGGLIWLQTRRTSGGAPRYPAVGRAFLCGALAFTAAQVLTRLPLMALLATHRAHPLAAFLLSGPVASYTAGLFEETGRLVVMVLLLRRFHRWIDGVSFGLGHGGIEAMLLVGLSYVSNLVIAVMINTGQWSRLAAMLPADRAGAVRDAMVGTPSVLFLAAGVERISAIGVHVALSVLVLWGVHRQRKALAWLVAVVLHGTVNLTAILMAGARIGPWWIELVLLVLAAALLVLAVRLRPAMAADVTPDLRRMPPPIAQRV
ncbi:YhfC family intramembrane metalloprotease [Raineyella fluvialis]|nr:YhfC family glutamic-type intramembrane protease [Raineyella fluvialis]